MERCIRCRVFGNEVRLFDAIYEGRMSSICERCSIIENVPIIKKPDSNKLKDSEENFGVYARMKMLAGIKDERQKKTFFIEDKLNELERKPELELPEEKQLNLVEHFHWNIMKNRRRKGLSQEKLADVLGESLTAIQMIEKAKLPENAEILIKKLEQFFQIKLRKTSETERIMKRKQRGPVLLDERGDELEFIPEPEIDLETEEYILKPEVHCRVELKKDSETPLLDDESIVECRIERPTRMHDIKKEEESEIIDIRKGKETREFKEFDIKKADLSGIRISDLKEIHKRKVEATKQEQIEEQRKIEERQRLIEAKKEEIRLMKERESQELDGVLGGSELLGDLKENDDSEKRKDFDEELI